MSVLGKIYGNNFTKPEQKGYKSGAKWGSGNRTCEQTSYGIISFELLIRKKKF